MQSAVAVTEVPFVKLTEGTPLHVWEADLRRQLAAQGIERCVDEEVERYVDEDVPYPTHMGHGHEGNPTHTWEVNRNLAKAMILRSLSPRVFRGLKVAGIDLWEEDSPKTILRAVIKFMLSTKALGLPYHLDCLMRLTVGGDEQPSVLPRDEDDSDGQYYLRLFLVHMEKLEDGGCSMTDAARFRLFLRGLGRSKYWWNVVDINNRTQRGLSWEAFKNDVLNGTEVLGLVS